MDDCQQDINDRKVLGTSWGTRTEDRKRAAKKMTMDDHQQDINDPRVLGTRQGGTMKMTRDNHQQDINDPSVTTSINLRCFRWSSLALCTMGPFQMTE